MLRPLSLSLSLSLNASVTVMILDYLLLREQHSLMLVDNFHKVNLLIFFLKQGQPLLLLFIYFVDYNSILFHFSHVVDFSDSLYT